MLRVDSDSILSAPLGSRVAVLGAAVAAAAAAAALIGGAPGFTGTDTEERGPEPAAATAAAAAARPVGTPAPTATCGGGAATGDSTGAEAAGAAAPTDTSVFEGGALRSIRVAGTPEVGGGTAAAARDADVGTVLSADSGACMPESGSPLPMSMRIA